MPNSITIQSARAEDAHQFIQLRGNTRENSISEDRLASLGVTAASWEADMRSGLLIGFTACDHGKLVGYCFGNTKTGEIVVLAILPHAEGKGVGKKLLGDTVAALFDLGHKRLFLGASPDPRVRSYGFYRHLGWRPTGVKDKLGDEVLELVVSVP